MRELIGVELFDSIEGLVYVVSSHRGIGLFDNIEGQLMWYLPTMDVDRLLKLCIGITRGSMLTRLRNQFVSYKMLDNRDKAVQRVMKLCKDKCFWIIQWLELELALENVGR